MNPILRIWGMAAALVALVLLLRGAWVLAIACFLFSPAPVLMFARGGADQRRLSISWLGLVVLAIVAFVGLVAAVSYFGGIPPIHEWRSAMRGTGA